MKKGDISTGIIEKTVYPDKGVIFRDDGKVYIKHAIPGRTVEYQITKRHGDTAQARILHVIKPSGIEDNEKKCVHEKECGGCLYQTVGYDHQLEIKCSQVKELLDSVTLNMYVWEGIIESPVVNGYRNKMEYSFGDEYKDGPLTLGMHKRESHYDIVTADQCLIVPEDFNRILKATLQVCKMKGLRFYHKISHKGYLRHLLIRRGANSGEIIADLVTTSLTEPFSENDINDILNEWKEILLSLKTDGRIVGILHTRNDSPADAVINQSTDILYGTDTFSENMLGLKFHVTVFSFFQTNSYGAEKLYQKVCEYAKKCAPENAFDLYCGTGTITQLLAGTVNRVTGVEIVDEAVKAAEKNARENDIKNASFISGDVLKVVDDLLEKPDLIVLDPPRDGIHPKALPKILSFKADHIIYVSCKLSSLIRDLPFIMQNGYRLDRACAIDMFPFTPNVETVVLLSRTEGTKESG